MLRVEPQLSTSVLEPGPRTGGGVDLTALVESGTFDFMGGGFSAKVMPDLTQLGGRYGWEISYFKEHWEDRVVGHLGVIGFANLYPDRKTLGGIGGIFNFRYEYVFLGRDSGSPTHHALAVGVGGQLDVVMESVEVDFFLNLGLSYVVYFDGLSFSI